MISIWYHSNIFATSQIFFIVEFRLAAITSSKEYIYPMFRALNRVAKTQPIPNGCISPMSPLIPVTFIHSPNSLPHFFHLQDPQMSV